MKSSLTILLLMITLNVNSQILGWHSKDILKHTQSESLEYSRDDDGILTAISFETDTNTFIQYFIDKDGICYSMVHESYSPETEKIIKSYNDAGYLKIDEGWLMRDNGVIFKIYYFLEKNGLSVFLWE